MTIVFGDDALPMFIIIISVFLIYTFLKRKNN
jgi:hypothetical protein